MHGIIGRMRDADLRKLRGLLSWRFTGLSGCFVILVGCSVSAKGKTETPGGSGAVVGSESAAESVAESESVAQTESEAETVAVGESGAKAVDGSTPALAAGTPAICRVEDSALADLCHRALDPIASDDDVALLAVLSDDVRFTRPGADGEPVVVEGLDALREEIADFGGPRGLVNLEDADRVVGRVVEDCRSCDKATVTVAATTRSGSVEVELLMSQPARARKIALRSTAGG